MRAGVAAGQRCIAAEAARCAIIVVAAWRARAETLAGTLCRALSASGLLAAFGSFAASCPPRAILAREAWFEGALATIVAALGSIEATPARPASARALPCRPIAGSRCIAEPAGAAAAARRFEATTLEPATAGRPFAVVAATFACSRATAPFTRARTSAAKATGASARPSGAATATRFARSTRSASVVVVAHDRVTLSAVVVKSGQVGVCYGLMVRRA